MILVFGSKCIQFHFSLQHVKFGEMPIYFSYIFLSVFVLNAGFHIFASSECLSHATWDTINHTGVGLYI